MALIVAQLGGVRILPQGTFYPYTWNEPWRRHEEFPDAHAVHHWTLSWKGEERY